MLISGVQPFTLLDYPDKTAAIVFTAGCNFRCGYCHNPEFVLPELVLKLKDSFIPEESFFNFLKSRRGLLEGVVVSGGEPTVQYDLIPFLKKIKTLGFKIKLDTNGHRPELVRQALDENLLDYIAMDVKTSLADYPRLVGPFVRPEKIKETMEIIKTSGRDYEFRSTLIKEVHSGIILAEMKTLLAGAKRLWLQTFRPGHTLQPAFKEYRPFSAEELADLADNFRATVAEVGVR